MESTQPLEVFFNGVNASAYSFGLYIQSHLDRFGTLPGEEGLTDRFTYEYTLAANLRFSRIGKKLQRPVGSVITKKGDNTVGEAIDTIRRVLQDLDDNKPWHLDKKVFPTRRAEYSLGWDFAWIFMSAKKSKHVIFVQVHRKKASPEDKFQLLILAKHNILEFNKNDQGKTFGNWLRLAVGEFRTAKVNVNGLYLIYGMPGCPVSWVTWDEAASTEISALVKIRRKTLTPSFLEDTVTRLLVLENPVVKIPQESVEELASNEPDLSRRMTRSYLKALRLPQLPL
ncbi:hypothetical protein BDV93DRAFT_549471 [Ceratobasidium sp. AG-I]|nr:hypothetical protein BDV93DRAFT_549471 [Ceratobasidium sp. AG-I]